MENKLGKKYGLFTAVAMVIGIVIGSGVFFKATDILRATGSLYIGIWSWVIGGMIMVSCSVAFSIMATKYQKVNGVVDYAEATMGGKYAYYLGWFLATLYYPSLTGVLAYVSSVYFCMLIGLSSNFVAVMAISVVFLTLSFILNTAAPKLAGHWQISSCVIKLVPLLAMAVGGTIYGLTTGSLSENFTVDLGRETTGNPLLYGVVATAFAYEGWIITTTINSELRNAKRNLPLALMTGGVVIIVIYLVYFVGVAGGVELSALSSKDGVNMAFNNVFGTAAGTILTAFITISCLGTLNGLTMGCARGIYCIAARGGGPAPKVFSKVSGKCKMPVWSCLFGFVMALIVTLYFGPIDFYGMYGQGNGFFFDISELPIVTLYVFYVPVFLRMMSLNTELGKLKRYVSPALALCGCAFMIIAAVDKFKSAGLVQYLLIFAAFMAAAVFFNKGGKAEGEISFE